MSKKIAQTAKNLARWYAHESLGQRKGVIVKTEEAVSHAALDQVILK